MQRRSVGTSHRLCLIYSEVASHLAGWCCAVIRLVMPLKAVFGKELLVRRVLCSSENVVIIYNLVPPQCPLV